MAEVDPPGALTWEPDEEEAAGTLPIASFKLKNWELEAHSTSGHLETRTSLNMSNFTKWEKEFTIGKRKIVG